jgi:hypothetical protein
MMKTKVEDAAENETKAPAINGAARSDDATKETEGATEDSADDVLRIYRRS